MQCQRFVRVGMVTSSLKHCDSMENGRKLRQNAAAAADAAVTSMMAIVHRRGGGKGGRRPPHTRFVCMRMNGRRRIAVCRPRPLSRWPDRERRARQSHQHHRHRDRIPGLRLRMLLSAPCRRASRTDGRYDCLPPASPRRVWAGRSYRSAAVASPSSSSIGPRAYRRPTVGRQ